MGLLYSVLKLCNRTAISIAAAMIIPYQLTVNGPNDRATRLIVPMNVSPIFFSLFPLFFMNLLFIIPNKEPGIHVSHSHIPQNEGRCRSTLPLCPLSLATGLEGCPDQVHFKTSCLHVSIEGFNAVSMI